MIRANVLLLPKRGVEFYNLHLIIIISSCKNVMEAICDLISTFQVTIGNNLVTDTIPFKSVDLTVYFVSDVLCIELNESTET